MNYKLSVMCLPTRRPCARCGINAWVRVLYSPAIHHEPYNGMVTDYPAKPWRVYCLCSIHIKDMFDREEEMKKLDRSCTRAAHGQTLVHVEPQSVLPMEYLVQSRSWRNQFQRAPDVFPSACREEYSDGS